MYTKPIQFWRRHEMHSRNEHHTARMKCRAFNLHELTSQYWDRMNHDLCTKFLHALSVLTPDSEAHDHVINDTVLFVWSRPSFAMHHTAAEGRTGKRPVSDLRPNAAFSLPSACAPLNRPR